MCGINGFFSLQANLNESHLRTMTKSLSHRGPDAEGIFFDGVCGLGHRRLSILDLSENANQPFYAQNERFVIVLNGEVYNYRELAKQLDMALRTTSDTEVILELFVKQNLRAFYQYNGMFAFAIYDRLERELYLCRDRIGIKPLFYYWDGQTFAFASEIKALQTLPQFIKEVNPAAIADFLHLGYIPAPQTIYKNIYKMSAGSWLKINASGLVQDKFWDLQEKLYDAKTQKKLSLLNKEPEAKAQLKKLLHSSINYQLISDVPLGVFLSGGIDSSLVTALAVAESNTQVNTFSIGFKENKFNESEYARKVANHLKTKHNEFIVSISEAKQLIPNLLDIYDEPFADSSAIPTLLVSRMASEHVKVVLGGDGGDELFFGYGMYQWANRLSKPLLQGFRTPIAQGLRMLRGNRYQKARKLLNYSKKQDLASHIFSQEQQLFSKKELQMLLNASPVFSNFQTFEEKRPLNSMEKQALFDLQYYLPDDLLVKVDRATMRYGLEARVPLLDHRLIEFAINLSPDLKFKKGVSKYLLKQVLYDYVPAKMFDRPKQGFAIPLVDWLKGDLQFLIHDYLNPDILNAFGLVNVNQVESMKKRFLKGNSFYYNRLWALIVLHQFLSRQ